MYATEWSPDNDEAASSIQSTLWSVILRTRDPKDPHRIEGLIRLCSAYSMALYAFARRKVDTILEAQGIVRGFFDHVRAGQLGRGHDAHRHRLRAFLLSAYQEYLGLRSTRQASAARGGGPPRAADFAAGEAWVAENASIVVEPETTFHRAWARCVLSQAYAALKAELAGRYGRAAAATVTAEVSPLERKPFNPDLAPKLGMAPAEVLDMLRESRRRMRDLILQTIRETVSAPSDVEVEFWDLFKSV